MTDITMQHNKWLMSNVYWLKWGNKVHRYDVLIIKLNWGVR